MAEGTLLAGLPGLFAFNVGKKSLLIFQTVKCPIRNALPGYMVRMNEPPFYEKARDENKYRILPEF